MAKIKGIEGMTADQLNKEIQKGGKFVVFRYCISIIIITFRRSSDVYFIKNNEGTFSKSIGFTLLSFLFGWWGIPWGPIYTIGSFITNFGGGKNVTDDILYTINQEHQPQVIKQD